ncbi:hypothetical protein ABIB00_007935 [Bradyrhizobium sp. LB14.3]
MTIIQKPLSRFQSWIWISPETGRKPSDMPPELVALRNFLPTRRTSSTASPHKEHVFGYRDHYHPECVAPGRHRAIQPVANPRRQAQVEQSLFGIEPYLGAWPRAWVAALMCASWSVGTHAAIRLGDLTESSERSDPDSHYSSAVRLIVPIAARTCTRRGHVVRPRVIRAAEGLEQPVPPVIGLRWDLRRPITWLVG